MLDNYQDLIDDFFRRPEHVADHYRRAWRHGSE